MKCRAFITALLALAISTPSFGRPLSDAALSWVDDADRAAAQERWADAEDALLHAIDVSQGDPSAPLLLSNLGMVRLYMGCDSAALATLDQAVAQAPGAATIRGNRARALFAVGRDDDAVRDLEKMMEIDSTLIEPRFYRGSLRLRRGDVEGAAQDFAAMQRLAPTAHETQIAMASLLDATGRSQEAIPYYNRVIEVDPDPVYYAGRARCLLVAERLQEASQDIEAGLKLAPEDSELYLLRAVLSKMQYRPDDAAADARRALLLGADPARVRQLTKP